MLQARFADPRIQGINKTDALLEGLGIIDRVNEHRTRTPLNLQPDFSSEMVTVQLEPPPQDAEERQPVTKKGITADHPTWCPGCGLLRTHLLQAD